MSSSYFGYGSGHVATGNWLFHDSQHSAAICDVILPQFHPKNSAHQNALYNPGEGEIELRDLESTFT
jgi:hypothetical protein